MYMLASRDEARNFTTQFHYAGASLGAYIIRKKFFEFFFPYIKLEVFFPLQPVRSIPACQNVTILLYSFN